MSLSADEMGVVSLRRSRIRFARFGAVAVATALASLAIAAGALGAVGDLTPAGCIADVDDLAGCGATAQGLESAADVAVSPDGTSVYAISESGDDAIVRFDRAPSGALTPAGCIEDIETNRSCDDVGPGGEAQGLDGAGGVAVSPDGKSVYVASENDEAIVRFDRSPSGALSNPSCVEDVETNGACDDVGAAGEAQGLNSAADVAVSPGGTSVYVVSFTDSAIVRFDRAASGALSNPSCIEDPPSDVGCGATAQGLDNARGVAVSPDGASVYAVSQNDSAIVRFDRAPNGALTPQGCISDGGDPAGCAAATSQGLAGARAVAVSPDGASVYAVSFTDDAIVRFNRAPSGALTAQQCISDVGDPAGCGGTAEGLNQGNGVAVSPDGASVYAVSGNDSAVVRFDRAPNGVLSNPSCIADPPDDAGCGTTAQGLDGASGVAVSPDGASVYAAGTSDYAIVRFDREVPPTPPPPEGEAPDTDPPETQITKGPRNKTRKKRATFEFTASEPGSTFACAVDGQTLKVPCASPYTVKVKKGKHTFQVRATDQSGNVDGSPASDGWKVKRKKKKK